jgi:hypothetical protein
MSLNACHCFGVMSEDRNKVDLIFNEIEQQYRAHILFKINSKHRRETYFDDGNRLIWVRPIENARGYRYHKLWLDKNITNGDILDNLVFAKLYMSKSDIIYF